MRWHDDPPFRFEVEAIGTHNVLSASDEDCLSCRATRCLSRDVRLLMGRNGTRWNRGSKI